MQSLWANVLAGEANSPGSFSKRTVNFLGDIDKKDAELFQILCRFSWKTEKFNPLIFDMESPIYKEKGLDFEDIIHLESIGLVNFNFTSGFEESKCPEFFSTSYCDQQLTLTMKVEPDNFLNVGMVLFTQVGRELASICEVMEVEGFFDYVKEKWSEHLPENQPV